MTVIRQSTILILLTLALVQTAAQNATNAISKGRWKTKVDVKYEKASDTTLVRLSPITLISNHGGNEQEELELSVSFSYPKQVIVTPKKIKLLISSLYAGGAGFDQNRKLRITADGTLIDLGDMNLVRVMPFPSIGTASIPWIGQDLSLSIDYDKFLSIAKSNDVRIAIGSKKFNLSQKQLQRLKDFAELMQQEGRKFGP